MAHKCGRFKVWLVCALERQTGLGRGMRGEVLMETVIALPLLMVLLLGLGQQFLVTEAQLDHVRIAQIPQPR